MIGSFGNGTALRMALWPAMILAAVSSAPALAECRQLAPLLQRQPTAEEWRQVESMGVVSWLTEVEGSPVKEGVAVGLVEAPPERVFEVVTDNARFADFMPYVKVSVVETLADGSLVNLQQLDLPWPIKDREYKITLFNKAGDTVAAPMWQSSWTHVKGFGNIEESRGAWRAFTCGDASLVEYQVYTDPGGSIPTYFKNTATRRSLRRLIEAVRDRARDPIYDPSD